MLLYVNNVIDRGNGGPRLDAHIGSLGLRSMPQADELHAGGAGEGSADSAHGVYIIKHIGVGAEFLHIVPDVDHDGCAAQHAEHAAGAHGIADALVHAVFHGNFNIVGIGCVAADQEGQDDEIRILQGFAAVGGAVNGRVDVFTIGVQFSVGPAIIKLFSRNLKYLHDVIIKL